MNAKALTKPKNLVAPTVPEPVTPAVTTTGVSEQSLHQFARRLNDLMISAGMNQSQLAAAVFGTTKDTRGFTVARGRDRISNYLRGRDVPRTANLARIAKVFKLSIQDLAPELIQSALDKSEPAVSMRMVAGQPDRVHLSVNTLMDLGTASQIIALISRATGSSTGTDSTTGGA